MCVCVCVCLISFTVVVVVFFVFAVLLFFPLLVVMMVIVLVMDGRSRTDMRSTAVQQQPALQSKAQTKCEEKALAKPERG